jgi:hypothetical protein
MRKAIAWSSSLLLPLLLGAPVLAAPAPAASGAPLSIPGGVADPAGKTGYVANDKGGIDALDLATGELLWSTREAPRPLIAFGNKLAAQAPVEGKANQVRVVVLDASAKGRRLLESDPVAFPDWVSVGLTHGRSFRSDARLGKGGLLLRWEANAFYAGGAAPTPQILEAARKHAAGTARIDLESGRVKNLEPDEVPADGPKLPAGLEKVVSRQYWTGSDWKTAPLVAGGVLAALDVQGGGKDQKMTLERWDLATGKALEPVELLKGPELWPQVSPDGRHVFVHEALVKEQLPPGDYAWWVFSLETGRRVGKFPFEPGSIDLTVIGPRAYYAVNVPRKGPPRPLPVMEQPRRLKAVDLASGKVAWERPIEGQRSLPPLP